MWKQAVAGIAVVAGLTACSQHAVLQSPQDSSPGIVTPFNLTTKSVLVHYPLTANSVPTRVALASDHNIWFNELNFDKVGKMMSNGTFTEYNLPVGHYASDIAPGPSNTVWISEYGTGFIGKLTTSGTLTEYPMPAGSFTEGIVKGPDGNMWFTDGGNFAVGKITPSGTVTEYTVPQASGHPTDITVGPDGNLWFTDDTFGLVGKVTTAGSITEFNGPGDEPHQITVGADGKLYAAADEGIWQITTAGAVKEFSTTDTVWQYITLGPDKQLWMTSPGFGALVEFNPKTSKFSSAIVPDVKSGQPGQIAGLAVGADGDVWIAGETYSDLMVYEEKIYSIGIRLNGEMSFNDPNYGFELGYAVGTGTQTQTVSLAAGESVQFSNLDSIPHSAAFLGNATQNSAPWPSSFNGSTSQSTAGTAIATSGFSTGPLNAGQKSPIYETGMPGFYMFGCQFHYGADKMRTVFIVH
ncbi:MAG TPA: hypothetical protein VEV38_00905 [Candidatus Eremiobacteraceae bacterium]|nr:hypothetical protein [Candidatus Eremiobacteraceae bacterium]